MPCGLTWAPFALNVKKKLPVDSRQLKALLGVNTSKCAKVQSAAVAGVACVQLPDLSGHELENETNDG